MRNRARRLAIGVALTPLALFGLVAVYAHGPVQVASVALAVGLFAIAVVVIFLLERPRDASDESVNDRVIALDLGVRWNRECSDAWFVQRDGGAALILKPDPDDPDRRLVVFVWARCVAARVGAPGAETTHEHPRFGTRLRACEWAAEVRGSSWVAEIADSAGAAGAEGIRHFVVLTRDETVEVAAPEVVVRRIDRIRLGADSAVAGVEDRERQD